LAEYSEEVPLLSAERLKNIALRQILMQCICLPIAVFTENIVISMIYVPVRVISAGRRNAVSAEEFTAMKHARIIRKKSATNLIGLPMCATDVTRNLPVY
jgi:hypothetical protein